MHAKSKIDIPVSKLQTLELVTQKHQYKTIFH